MSDISTGSQIDILVDILFLPSSPQGFMSLQKRAAMYIFSSNERKTKWRSRLSLWGRSLRRDTKSFSICLWIGNYRTKHASAGDSETYELSVNTTVTSLCLGTPFKTRHSPPPSRYCSVPAASCLATRNVWGNDLIVMISDLCTFVKLSLGSRFG